MIPDGNPDDIITKMIQEKGRLSQVIFESIKVADPFLAALAPTKRFFPEGMGDQITDVVLDVNRPNESDVLGWSRVGAAKPGYNPCCQTYKEITYGSRTVSACLYQDGWRSPAFCKIDLAFKFQRDRQIRQQLEIMTQWTQDIWSHWGRRSFVRSVEAVVLDSTFGHPEQLGGYVPYTVPRSVVTFQHLEQLFLRIRGAGGELSQPVRGFELIYIGDEELRKLCELYFKEAAADYGARQTYTIGDASSRLPELNVPGLGTVKRLGKYLFSVLQYPVRYRDRTGAETWEDAIVPSTINVATERGHTTIENPDYRNPAIAKYSEAYWFNLDAVQWLVPPAAMTGSNGLFPATDYSGDFELIAPPKGDKDDPKQKTVYFLADFMSGMLAHFPRRARAILSLAVHTSATDVVDVTSNGAVPDITKYFVQETASLIGAGAFQMVVTGTLPAACPAGYALFAVSKSGKSFFIDSVDATEVFAGDETLVAGTKINVTFAADSIPDLSCEVLDYIACLPESDTIAAAVGEDPDAVTVAEARVVFVADNLVDLQDGGVGVSLVGGPFTAAAAAKVAIDAYLAALPSDNVATVTAGSAANGYEWTIVVTGTNVATVMADHAVEFVDAQGNTVTEDFVISVP